MKHRTRIIALFLACVMVLPLAACSNKTSPAPISTLPPDFVAEPDVEDLWEACSGIDSDLELFTVNGEPVTARAYLYFLASSIFRYAQETNGIDDTQVEGTYTQNYGVDWTTVMEDGTSLVDYLKKDALDAIAMSVRMVSIAEEQGFGMTQDQADELNNYLEMMILMTGGEDVFNDQLRMIGLDRDTFYEFNAYYYYYNQLLEGMFADTTDEEVAAYIKENDVLYAKHILLMTVDPNTREPLDEETAEEKRVTAENLLAQLQNSSDLLADFDTLMNEYSEDSGLVTNPDGYLFTAGDMVSSFEEGTRALEYGEISGLVTSEWGYHIILRLDPADNETIRDETRVSLLEKQLDTWTEEAEVVFSDEYNALDVPLFYAKYLAYRDAFDEAMKAAEAEAEETAEPEVPDEGEPAGTENSPEPEAAPSPEAGDEPAED